MAPSLTAADIKATRVRMGLTQPQFARVVGAHPMTVSKWERGLTLPEGLYAAAIRRLGSSHSMDRTALADLLRHDGVAQTSAALTVPQIAVTRAVTDGVNLAGWEVSETAGAILFVRRANVAPTDPARNALEAERAVLAADLRRLLADSYHQPDARTRRDAAQQRKNAIDRELATLPAPEPTAPPIEGVLCVNVDPWADTSEWEAIAHNAGFPLAVLFRGDWKA